MALVHDTRKELVKTLGRILQPGSTSQEFASLALSDTAQGSDVLGDITWATSNSLAVGLVDKLEGLRDGGSDSKNYLWLVLDCLLYLRGLTDEQIQVLTTASKQLESPDRSTEERSAQNALAISGVLDPPGRRYETTSIATRWATDSGHDRYGTWASVEVFGVPLRMRFIEPALSSLGRRASSGGQSLEPFWLAETPCTQALWRVATGENPSTYEGPRVPVHGLSWLDVQRFLEEVNQEAPELTAILPTEIQWEYACRSGLVRTQGLDDIAWHQGNSGGRPQDVAQLQPSSWGLFDMHGNVWEWCDPTERAQRRGRRGRRSLRGGSWREPSGDCQAASRLVLPRSERLDSVGFRIARMHDARVVKNDGR